MAALFHFFLNALQKIQAGWSNTKSMEFDGIDDYVNVPNHSSLNITDNLSISFWFKTTETGYFHYFLSKADTGELQYFVRMRDGNIMFTVYEEGDGSPSKQIRGSGVYNDGNWHHAVCTFSSGTIKLYVDGSEDLSGSISGTGTSIGAQTADLTLAAYAQNGQYQTCSLDEVTIWDTAVLDSGDVTELYNSGIPQDPTTITTSANLVSYWQMGDSPDTISTIQDRVGSNDGTPTNMDSGDIVTDVPIGNVDANRSISFNGTDEAIAFTDFPDFEKDQPFSVSAWIKPSASNIVICGKQDISSGNYGWRLALTVGGQLRFELVSTASTVMYGLSADSLVTDGSTWYHVIGTYDGDYSSPTFTFYIDGVASNGGQSGSIPGGETILHNDVYRIGRRSGNFFNGLNAGCAIWNKVLSAIEAQRIHSNGVAGNLLNDPAGTNLVRWQYFNTSTDLESASGVIDALSAGDGTASNMTNASNLDTELP